MDQEKFVRKAQKGNRKALEILLKEMYLQMYKTAFIYMKNEQDALDVVQETAFKVTQKIHTLKESSYFKTWVTKILIRCAFDLLEKNKKAGSSLNEEQEIERSRYENHGEDNVTDMHLTLVDAIHRLKPNEQNMIILYYFNDLPIKEIANLLLCPEGTVKYNLHKAREELRVMLEGVD